MLLFRWVYPPSKYPSKIKKKSGFRWTFLGKYSKMRVEYFGKSDLKWVAVAQIGLKLWENEATRSRTLFKPDF